MIDQEGHGRGTVGGHLPRLREISCEPSEEILFWNPFIMRLVGCLFSDISLFPPLSQSTIYLYYIVHSSCSHCLVIHQTAAVAESP